MARLNIKMEASRDWNGIRPHRVVRLENKATIEAYSGAGSRKLDINSGPLEILLFCVRQGSIHLQASFIPHPIEVSSHEAIFLANPRGEWGIQVIQEKNAEFYLTRMEASYLHQLIHPGFDQTQLQEPNRINVRDLMRLLPVSPPLILCFEQLMHHKLNPPFQVLYEEAKFMEIFSLLMEAAFGQPGAICPVAMSPSIEHKLSQVRRHIMENIEEMPDPDELARQYDLPRTTLKEGYKFKYGKTLHQFHADHKLESALQMLTSGEMLVKEVAFKIGYQNPSHFITAFKKKFGFTPKQFLKQPSE